MSTRNKFGTALTIAICIMMLKNITVCMAMEVSGNDEVSSNSILDENVEIDVEAASEEIQKQCLAGEIMGAAFEIEEDASQWNNDSDQNYYTWSKIIKSYMTIEEEGFQCVSAGKNKLLIEKYNSVFQLKSTKTIQYELPIFGGFYAGERNYYIVEGKTNPSEDDACEVMRLIKYDKEWNRLGTVSLYGANTVIPFDAGSLRMAEAGDKLYIRTCHEMYTTLDGLNHQANLMWQINTANMESELEVSCVASVIVGYVSHSFNQFVITDEKDRVITLDHGDSYPRSIVLCRYTEDDDRLCVDYENVFKIPGEHGDNNTYTSVGGLEYSDQYYLTAGVSNWKDENTYSKNRNVFMTLTPKENETINGSSSVKWFTEYTGETGAATPHLVKITTDTFLLMWEEVKSYVIPSGVVRYAFVDGSGNLKSDIYKHEGYLSDCKPVVNGDMVIWYVTKDGVRTFYQIWSDGRWTQREDEKNTEKPTAKFSQKEIVCSLFSKNVINKLKTNSDGTITYKSSNPKVASVNKYGRLNIKKKGTCIITASISKTKKYAATTVAYKVKVRTEPKLLSAKIISNKKIKIKWQKLEGADKYILYQKVNGKWKKLKVLSETSYVHKGSKNFPVNPKGNNTYTVKACYIVNNKEKYTGSSKKGITCRMKSYANNK